MIDTLRRSIRAKLTVAMLATTTIALFVTAILLIGYDYNQYKTSSVNDLASEAEMLGRAAAPALAANDRGAAQRLLALQGVRPRMLAAAIYGSDGTPFATFVREGVTDAAFPRLPQPDGDRVEGNRLVYVKHLRGAHGPFGTVYLASQYQLGAQLGRYVEMVAAVMILSLLVGLLVSHWMERSITRPIFAIREVAQQVKNRRDFTLRVQKTTEDEVGDLVDSINEMLAEMGHQAQESEKANITLAHEIAIREDAESALRAVDQRKDEFLATLAHELRNPLAPLRNALEILRLSSSTSSEALKAREVMDRQLKQLVRLVDDLLDVTRITTGKLTLRRADVAWSAIAETTLDATAPFIEGKGHQLSVRSPDEPVMLYGDAVRLAQVFVNLLHNAAKFTPAGGKISFEAERIDDTVRVTVADNGMGIPPELLPLIFDMFAQLDRSLERPHAGLGVGLSLARRLVELHGGTLEAESAGPGQGARFVVRLPIKSGADEGVPAVAEVA